MVRKETFINIGKSNISGLEIPIFLKFFFNRKILKFLHKVALAAPSMIAKYLLIRKRLILPWPLCSMLQSGAQYRKYKSSHDIRKTREVFCKLYLKTEIKYFGENTEKIGFQEK